MRLSEKPPEKWRCHFRVVTAKKIEKFLKTKGNALVPVKLFISDKGWLKVLISCATGKKTHDKRQDLKLKDDRREMDRALKSNR